MVKLALLFWVTAHSLPAQFLEFQIQFDDGGCVSGAESLEDRMQRVRGVEMVTLDLAEGLIRLRLAADNRVRLVPLMSRVEQGGAKALTTTLTVKGQLITDGGARKLELLGSAAGQTYTLVGDADGLEGAVIVEAAVLDAANGSLEIVSIRPAE
jgi:hypothetical protein